VLLVCFNSLSPVCFECCAALIAKFGRRAARPRFSVHRHVVSEKIVCTALPELVPLGVAPILVLLKALAM
jgi:hypothetical protein